MVAGKLEGGGRVDWEGGGGGGGGGGTVGQFDELSPNVIKFI